MILSERMTHNAHKKYVVIALIVLCGAFIGVMGGILYAVAHDLPQIRALEDFQPSSSTRIYSTDNVLLAELFVEKRHPIALDEIPHDLKQALIAAEDRTFYQHNGVDLKGILRAVVKNILVGRFAEGASTISQQLAKTLFLTPKKKLIRKIKEAFLAFQLERRYTKDEILALYLNQIYFGSGAYGVESASRIFFGKSVKDLSLAECALIAGMPPAPSKYSPWINRDLALKRRAIVLGQMKGVGYITSESYDAAMVEPLALSRPKDAVKAPYFVAYTQTILEEMFGPSQLYSGGLNVHTTLSYDLQVAAERAVSEGLFAIEKRMKRSLLPKPEPQCGLISLDVHSGAIFAMVGGKDYSESPFNRTTLALRQPGSAFKPIVYAYAIEQGSAQNQIILDAPIVFRGADGHKDWRPENYSEKYLGEIPLRRALALSKNIPAVRLLESLGSSSVVRYAESLGITTPLIPNLSLALGTSEVTLIDLTRVYAVFANGGRAVEPYCIAAVMDSRGRSLLRANPRQRVAISQAVAAIITNMLEAVVQEGTGRKAQVLRRPLAGKTGTSDDFKDALFVGYSPSIAAGVWVGQDGYDTLGGGESGARAALPIWVEYMSAALANTPYEVFSIPDDVVQVPIDPLTGQVITDDALPSVKALFKKGTEPRLEHQR